MTGLRLFRRANRPGSMPARLAFVLIAAAALSGAPEPARGQSAPAFGGAELRVGLTVAEDAELAAGVFGEVDLGYVRTPQLRLLAGLSRYQANIDREPGGDEGSFTATGLWVNGRYDLLPWGMLAPYLRAGLTLQSVDADAFDRDVGALLDGTYLGVAAGVGARYRLDTTGQLAATAELRRTLINNVGNTALDLGVRFQRLGWGAYVPDGAVRAAVPPPRAPAPVAAPVPVAAPASPAPGVVAPHDTLAQRRLAELEHAVREAERALVQMRDARAAAPAAAPRVAAPPPPEDVAGREAMLRQGLDRAVAGMRSLVEMQETDDHFMVTIQEDAFPGGTGSLGAAARDEMRVLATVLAGYRGHIVNVEGHTDATGDAGANRRLSEARAAAVRAALIVEGVDPLWLGSRGFGSQRPVASNETAAGRAANRRVEIRVSKQPCPTPPRTAPDGTLECPPSGGP